MAVFLGHWVAVVVFGFEICLICSLPENEHQKASSVVDMASLGVDNINSTLSHPTGGGSATTALLMSTVAGASTTLGAFVVLLMNGVPGPSHLAFSLALAGGVMLSVSVMELWLPHLASADGIKMARFFMSTGLGAGASLLLSHMIPEPDMADFAKDGLDLEMAGESKDNDKGGAAKRRRLALVMMMALTAHNFPEGIAVAVSSLESQHVGLVVMIAIAVHNVPEGIAIAVPVLDATRNHWKAVIMASMSGLAEPVGALMALTVLPRSMTTGDMMENLLSFVGGIMSAVALKELLPEAYAQNRPHAMYLGFLIGIIVMLLTIEFV